MSSETENRVPRLASFSLGTWLRQLSLRIHFAIVIVLVAVTTPLTYLVVRNVFGYPARDSAEAIAIDRLFEGHYWMIAFLFSLIVVMVLYSLYMFHAAADDLSPGADFHGNTAIELAWIAIPTVIVLLFGYWGFVVLGDINDPQNDEMVVEVTGFQFGWSFSYPELDGMNTAEMYIPVNTQVRLEMTSRDVLHAFWVPEFRVKQDLVPGRTTEVRITPNKEGIYTIRCAEVCGPNHYDMYGTINVLSQADYDAWVAEQQASADAREGSVLARDGAQ